MTFPGRVSCLRCISFDSLHLATTTFPRRRACRPKRLSRGRNRSLLLSLSRLSILLRRRGRSGRKDVPLLFLPLAFGCRRSLLGVHSSLNSRRQDRFPHSDPGRDDPLPGSCSQRTASRLWETRTRHPRLQIRPHWRSKQVTPWRRTPARRLPSFGHVAQRSIRPDGPHWSLSDRCQICPSSLSSGRRRRCCGTGGCSVGQSCIRRRYVRNDPWPARPCRCLPLPLPLRLRLACVCDRLDHRLQGR